MTFNRANTMRVLADVLQEKEMNDQARKGFDMNVFVRNISGSEFSRLEADEFVLEAGKSPTLCGTQLCVAGFATLEAGWKFKFTKHDESARFGKDPNSLGYVTSQMTFISPEGEEQTYEPNWDYWGTKYLGISEFGGRILFYATYDSGEGAIAMLEELLRLNRDMTDEEWSAINSEYDEREEDAEYEDEDYCSCGCMDD